MCTLEKRGNIYILTLTGSGEHRLNPSLLDSIQSFIRDLKAQPTSPSSALITTAQGKFFSNGYDLAWAHSSLPLLQLMSSKLRSLVSDLLSLPMPTIAAVTGHASAAGMILALAHDYVVMRKDRGFLYMSEVDIGLVIPDWFGAVLKGKMGNSRVVREVILKAPKLTAEAAVERGIVDVACEGADATVEAAVEMGEGLVRRGWDGHVYAGNRVVVLEDVVERVNNGFDGNGQGHNRNSGFSKSKL